MAKEEGQCFRGRGGGGKGRAGKLDVSGGGGRWERMEREGER